MYFDTIDHFFHFSNQRVDLRRKLCFRSKIIILIWSFSSKYSCRCSFTNTIHLNFIFTLHKQCNIFEYTIWHNMCEEIVELRSVSKIRTSYTWIWWFNFRLEQIFYIDPTASKNDARFKSGQKWLESNHLALLA